MLRSRSMLLLVWLTPQTVGSIGSRCVGRTDDAPSVRGTRSGPERVECRRVERDGRDLREETVSQDTEERLIDVERPAVALAARAVDGDDAVVVRHDVAQIRAVCPVRQDTGLPE